MIIQSLAQCGLFGTVLILLLFIIYFRRIRNNEYKFVMTYFLAAGMLVTDFYADPFVTVAMMLFILL